MTSKNDEDRPKGKTPPRKSFAKGPDHPHCLRVQPFDAHYFNIETVSAYLGGAVPISTIRWWLDTGKLKAIKPGKVLLVKRDDLVEFLDSSEYLKIKAERTVRAGGSASRGVLQSEEK